MTDRAQIDAGVVDGARAPGSAHHPGQHAGLDGFDPFLKITAEKWNRILAVNLTGTFDCCQAVVPDMIEEGWGRIVNISSSSAQSGQPIMTHYVASKAGVIGFTKALALELGPKGITVNTIPPGLHRHPDAAEVGEQGACSGEGVEHHEAQHPGAPGRPARGHRRGLLLPRARRGQLRHRSGHRGQRRTEHLTWPASRRCRPASGPRRWARPSPRCARPTPATPSRPAGEDRPKGLNILGTLAQHPALAQAFHTFNGHVLFASTLSPRQRELLVLRVAAVREVGLRVGAARRAGRRRRARRRTRSTGIAEGPDAPGWSPLDEAMVRAVDELIGDAADRPTPPGRRWPPSSTSSSSWTWSSPSAPTTCWPWPSARSASSWTTTCELRK